MECLVDQVYTGLKQFILVKVGACLAALMPNIATAIPIVIAIL